MSTVVFTRRIEEVPSGLIDPGTAIEFCSGCGSAVWGKTDGSKTHHALLCVQCLGRRSPCFGIELTSGLMQQVSRKLGREPSRAEWSYRLAMLFRFIWGHREQSLDELQVWC